MLRSTLTVVLLSLMLAVGCRGDTTAPDTANGESAPIAQGTRESSANDCSGAWAQGEGRLPGLPHGRFFAMPTTPGTVTQRLVANGADDIGSVTATIASGTLTVSYTLNTPTTWQLSRAQLLVRSKAPGAEDPERFPYRSGPITGSTYAFTVPMSTFGGSPKLFLAAHARVCPKQLNPALIEFTGSLAAVHLEGEFDQLILSDQGEQLFLSHYAGSTKIDRAMLLGGHLEPIAMDMDEVGRITLIQTEGQFILFGNYRDELVDVVFLAADGTSAHFKDVPIATRDGQRTATAINDCDPTSLTGALGCLSNAILVTACTAVGIAHPGTAATLRSVCNGGLIGSGLVQLLSRINSEIGDALALGLGAYGLSACTPPLVGIGGALCIAGLVDIFSTLLDQTLAERQTFIKELAAWNCVARMGGSAFDYCTCLCSLFPGDGKCSSGEICAPQDKPVISEVSQIRSRSGDIVTFSAEASHHPTSWKWHFDSGVGSVADNTLQSIPVRLMIPGIYHGQVRAYNEWGESEAVPFEFEVLPRIYKGNVVHTYSTLSTNSQGNENVCAGSRLVPFQVTSYWTSDTQVFAIYPFIGGGPSCEFCGQIAGSCGFSCKQLRFDIPQHQISAPYPNLFSTDTGPGETGRTFSITFPPSQQSLTIVSTQWGKYVPWWSPTGSCTPPLAYEFAIEGTLALDPI